MTKTVFIAARVEHTTTGPLVHVIWEDHTLGGRHSVYLPREVAEAAFQHLFGDLEYVVKAERFYTVKEGECLSKIALRFGVTCSDLVLVNSLPDQNYIRVGQRLLIPERRP